MFPSAFSSLTANHNNQLTSEHHLAQLSIETPIGGEQPTSYRGYQPYPFSAETVRARFSTSGRQSLQKLVKASRSFSAASRNGEHQRVIRAATELALAAHLYNFTQFVEIVVWALDLERRVIVIQQDAQADVRQRHLRWRQPC